MVLLIKSRGSQVDNYRKIAAQMINMETNQKVYDNDAKELYPNTSDTVRPKFNVYNHNSIEFEFSLTTGIIVLYLKDDSNYDRTDHAALLIEEIQKLSLPVNFSETVSSESKYYTMAKTKLFNRNTSPNANFSNGKVYRKIITDPYYFKKSISSNEANFVWVLIVKTEGNFRGSYLSIQELDSGVPSEIYLNKSICTIIYDDTNMFDIRGIKQQINYPSIEQYRMFSQNQLVEEPIYVSWKCGLQYEIYYQFTGKKPILNNLSVCEEGFLAEESSLNRYKLITTELPFKDANLKRLNLDKPWKEQLLEPFNYKKQEEDEINLNEEGKPIFPNDICFISKIPLWDKFYVIRIKNETDEFNIALSPSVVHGKIRYDGGYLGFGSQILMKTENISIMSVSICSHPRTFLQVLDMFPNKINPIKKNIMRCMEIYGAYSKASDVGNKTNTSKFARNYYVMDKVTEQMYVGVQGCNDTHIILYQNTSTILFRVLIIENLHYLDQLDD